MESEKLTKKEQTIITLILLSVLILVGSDLISDSKEGMQWPHFLLESSVGIAAAIGLFIFMKKSYLVKHELKHAQDDYEKLKKENEEWKNEARKYIDGLSQAIDTQLNRWSLTAAEKEVAFLLLKGMSLKEVANIRNTSEKTARAQSLAIYHKSGLGGRSELSAFFLEDLLSPQETNNITNKNL